MAMRPRRGRKGHRLVVAGQDELSHGMGAYSIVGPSGLPLSPIPTSIMESSSGGGVDLPAPSDGNGSGADAQPVLKKPRRNPALSCQLCRTKKIKCDRNRPCANCVTRGAECRPQDGEPLFPLNYAPCPEPSLKRPYEPYDAADGSSATRSPSSGPRHSSGSSARGTHSPTQGFSLQVNETSWMRSPELPSSGISMLSLVASHQAEMRDQDSLKTANLLEEIAMGMRDENGRTHDEPLPPEVALRQKRLADIRDLEQTRQSGRIELFSGADFFKMTDEQGFQSTSSANSGSHGPSSMHSSIELITAQLPPEAHASIIAANYFDLVHPLFHILHRPTVETSIGEVYSRADRVYTSRRRAAGLALIYAVLAVGAHFWPSSRKDAASGLSHEDLREPCRRWRTLSIDALSLGRFLGAPSLEALQTLCTLPLVLNNVGESETFRNLFGAVIRMAHTLGLHRMGVERKPSEDRVTWETKRRVWHYIASSDWLESCHGGPRQGIAMVNPKLMDTSFPSNCSDEDICAGRGEGNGLDVPTPMSFSFFRYQLAQVCYDAVELLGLNVYLGDGNQADYEKILLVDRRYHDLLRNFPTHYRNDTKARSDSAGVIAQQPYIAWQRIMLHLGCHSMLIRLHRPFLISGAHEPRVAYSRMICLRSAHQVLRLCHQSLQDGFTHSLRLWTCIHHYFMAAVILSIDFYCNYDEFSADETRKEVLAACAVLESARKESTIAEQGLRVLHTILRRWKDSQNLDAAAAAQHAEDTAVATTAPAAAELDSAANTTTEATAAAGGRQLSMTLSQQQQDEDELDDFMIPPTVGVGEVPLYSELTGLGASEETANMDWTGLLGNLDGISDQWWEQLGGGFMS